MKKMIVTSLAIAAFAMLFSPGTAHAWKNLPYCWQACGCGTPCPTRCSSGLLSSRTCGQYGVCRDLCFLRPSGGGDDGDNAQMIEANFIESLNGGVVEEATQTKSTIDGGQPVAIEVETHAVAAR